MTVTPETPPQEEEFVTQKDTNFRERLPAWLRQFPYPRFPPRKPNFQLIDPQKLAKELENADADAVAKIQADIEFLDNELLRLFRERDYRASHEQNRYRMYQIGYMLLAALAGLIGALQALTLTGDPQWAATFAFLETAVAAFVTYLATIRGHEPPLPAWLMHRRRAEYLRREYFRFLLNLSPYDEVVGPRRKQLLSERAADINRGVFPDKQATS